MTVLDLIFKHYEDVLLLSEHFYARKPMLNDLEAELRKSLNKKQLSAFNDWNFIRTDSYELAQKDAFKCGMRAGAQLILDLMDKDATDLKEIFEELKKSQE